MAFSSIFREEKNLVLDKKTVVVLRWIALIGQLITIYIVHFYLNFKLPIIFCSLTIFFGGVTNIFLQFYFKKNQLSNFESTILLFYDVIQLTILLFLTGGATNPFVIFLIVPSIVSSTLLNLTSTVLLGISTIILLTVISIFYFPLPHPGNLHFHVPDYYLFSIPVSLIIVLAFLNYFGFRFGYEARRRVEALNKLEIILAKEQELDSIGHQAAAAAHSLGTPLSTITVIAKELKKEISANKKYTEDIDILLTQAKRCSEILKKLSKREIVDDEYISNITMQDLLFEITKSFEEITEKKIVLNLDKCKEKIKIKRSPEITYGIRNFIGNAVKFADDIVSVHLVYTGNKIIIEIKDDGPGFPSDIIKFIGDPYIFSSNEKVKNKAGLGLGTFIGKTLLERKKANIEFLNNGKRGALVKISWDDKNLNFIS